MITVIDYGAGNLFSVQNALNFLNINNNISDDIKEIEKADALILPGVGAFPDAMKMLHSKGLVDLLKNWDKPLLGICLGMQMLFECSYEFEKTCGLGLIPGSIKKIRSADEKGNKYKIPHMGWNEMILIAENPLLIDSGEYVYFVHSFAADTDDKYIISYVKYSQDIPALVSNKNVFGAQFHPEKSGEAGLNILRRFAKLVEGK